MRKGPLKILLIEDDNFISEIYCHKLTDSGFNVKSGRDGLEGLALFRDFKPDLVLLDIMLPKKSGWEVLKELRASGDKKAKIIMLTNLGEKDKIKQALEMGADDYLIKASLTPTELAEIIRDKME